MFKKLFKQITTLQPDNVKITYNEGVKALAKGELEKAISLFVQIHDKHPSAAYNLGLIYLDGDGQITPKYTLARKFFQIADQLGHERAKFSAQIIGLKEERKLSRQEEIFFFEFAVAQYVAGRQLGNLAYLIAYDIKRNILESSSNELYRLIRFLSYEVYLIRKYGDKDVKALYETSSLRHWNIVDIEDWENGEIDVISDYLTEKTYPWILRLGNGALQFHKLGTVRLAAVNAVYEYYSNHEESHEQSDR